MVSSSPGDLLTERAAAAVFGIAQNTLRHRMRNGSLMPSATVLTSTHSQMAVFSYADLEAHFAAYPVHPGKQQGGRKSHANG